MTAQHVPTARWHKSSYSNDTANCVEMAAADSDTLVRDSKDLTTAPLTLSAGAWTALRHATSR